MSDIQRQVPDRTAYKPKLIISKRTHIWAGALLVMAMLSLFVLAPILKDPIFLHGLLSTIDANIQAVSALAAGALGAAGLLSAAATTTVDLAVVGFDPGATLAPIAERVTDVSGWLLIVVGALVLQKVLLALVGSIAFGLVIPIACGLGIVALYTGRTFWRVIAVRLAAFAVVLLIAVPGSIWLSSEISNQYADIEAAQDRIDQATGELTAQSTSNPASNPLEAIGQFFSDAGTAVAGAMTQFVDTANEALNDLTMTFIILLITACIIPVLSLFLIAWVVKLLFGGAQSGRRVPRLRSEPESLEADPS